MTPEQENHLKRIIDSFTISCTGKYTVGAKEHGGDLLRKDLLDLLYEVKHEIVDGFTYIDTAIDLLENLGKAQREEYSQVTIQGNKADNCMVNHTGRKRVYVAGAYSSNNIIKVLDNMRRGMRIATEVFVSGYAPFCPFLDYHFQLQLREGEILSVNDYYEYSLAWLRVSDALLVLPNWEDSEGTKKEIQLAKELNIPIFYNLNELKENLPCKN